jgi:hypothetical protein
VLLVFDKAARILDQLDEADLRQKISEDPILLLRFLTVLARLCECAIRLERAAEGSPAGSNSGLAPGASDESIAIVERAMGLL